MVITARAPASWSDAARERAIDALAAANGIEKPYRIDLQDGPHPEIVFAATGKQLRAVLDRVAEEGRRIGAPKEPNDDETETVEQQETP